MNYPSTNVRRCLEKAEREYGHCIDRRIREEEDEIAIIYRYLAPKYQYVILIRKRPINCPPLTLLQFNDDMLHVPTNRTSILVLITPINNRKISSLNRVPNKITQYSTIYYFQTSFDINGLFQIIEQFYRKVTKLSFNR